MDTYGGCILTRKGSMWRTYLALNGYQGTWLRATTRERLCERIDAARSEHGIASPV